MKRFAKLLLVTFGFGVFGLAMSLVPQKTATGAGSAPVTVVNTSPIPVSLSGTGTISGNVNANITNTPTVNLATGTTVGLLGTPNVNANITNSHLSVEEPGTPIAINLCIQATFGFCGGQQASYSIPSANHLIVENVAGSCNVETGSGQVNLNGVSLAMTTSGTMVNPAIAFPYFPPPQAPSGSNIVSSYSQPMRLYGDPGTTVLLNVNAVLASDSSMTCTAVLSGRLTTP